MAKGHHLPQRRRTQGVTWMVMALLASPQQKVVMVRLEQAARLCMVWSKAGAHLAAPVLGRQRSVMRAHDWAALGVGHLEKYT